MGLEIVGPCFCHLLFVISSFFSIELGNIYCLAVGDVITGGKRFMNSEAHTK